MPTGSCMCGDISYEYTGEPAVTALCHCSDCQKWSGGGTQSMVGVPSSAFNVTKGTPKSFTTIGADSGKEHARFFCGNCGSSLYSQPASMPGVTIIRAGGLDNGASEIPIAVEFFSPNRRGFVHAVEGAQQAKTMS